MQNFTLLRELGHARKPVLLKRGISATIEEWLLSAEYVLSGGNTDVILCERGIRTFETATRNTFDISAIPVVKKLSHLPIVADPSHGAGRRDMVAPMARAAVAAGADGLIIEVHCDPGPRAERRRAVDVPGAVRSADGGAAHHRAGDRPQHLPRAGRAARMGRVELRWNCRLTDSDFRLASSIDAWSCLSFSRRRAPRRSRRSSQKIGIVGLGLIGGSIALAARQLWPSSLVIAVDNKDVLETAMRLHAIDVAADDLIVLAEADLVILAAPVRQNLALLDELDENVRQPAVVTDTGSTKRAIVEAARGCRRGSRSSAAIRSAGAAASGPRARAAGSFKGRPWLFTPASDAAGDALEKLFAFARALGADAADDERRPAHDRLLAFLSHLPQLTASALMQVVGEAVGRGRPGAGRPRARRHDAARVEPGRDLEGHRRHQRRRDRRGARHPDRAAAGSARAISRTAIGSTEVFEPTRRAAGARPAAARAARRSV